MRFFWGRGPGPKPGGNPLFGGHREEDIKKETEMEWPDVGKKPESIIPNQGKVVFQGGGRGQDSQMPVRVRKDKG